MTFLFFLSHCFELFFIFSSCIYLFIFLFLLIILFYFSYLHFVVYPPPPQIHCIFHFIFLSLTLFLITFIYLFFSLFFCLFFIPSFHNVPSLMSAVHTPFVFLLLFNLILLSLWPSFLPLLLFYIYLLQHTSPSTSPLNPLIFSFYNYMPNVRIFIAYNKNRFITFYCIVLLTPSVARFIWS